jgi:hypothetical protein
VQPTVSGRADDGRDVSSSDRSQPRSFGCKRRSKPFWGTKRGPAQRASRKKRAAWEMAVERPESDLTVFKVRCGLFTLKIYTQGERVLGVKTIAHNAKKLRRGYSLQSVAEIAQHLQGMLERFMELHGPVFFRLHHAGGVTCSDTSRQDPGGRSRCNRPRMRWVVHAVLALASNSRGFTASQLAHQVRSLSRDSESKYGSRHAAYDLKSYAENKWYDGSSRPGVTKCYGKACGQ